MADYTSVLARAVAGKATYEERRAVYERARQALVAQLRAMEPPLPESDITRQRLALEESIRKVETDASGAAAAARAPAAPPRAEAPAAEPVATPAAPPEPARQPAPAMPVAPAAPVATLPAMPAVAAAPLAGLAREAGDLGGASARAAKSAREQLASEAPAPVQAPPAAPVAEAPVPAPAPAEAGDGALTRVRNLPGTIYQEPTETNRGLVAFVVVAVLLLAAGIGIWVFQDRILPQAAPTQTATGGTTAFQPGKANERVAPEGARPGQPIAVQAQAFLYEDNTDASRNVTGLQGRVTWRIDTDANRQGAGPERVIRGFAEIPERNLRLLVTIRRNTDPTLPASHTLELLFETPADFIHGAVDGVPGVRMKPSEQAQGIALVGPTVRITAGYFLTGLSSLGPQRDQNIVLLRDRPWMDVPIVYRNGRLAVLTLEKGPTGDQVFQDAFRAWGN